jgi:hypothetical protein
VSDELLTIIVSKWHLGSRGNQVNNSRSLCHAVHSHDNPVSPTGLYFGEIPSFEFQSSSLIPNQTVFSMPIFQGHDMEALTHRYTITTITLSLGTYLLSAILVWVVAKRHLIGERRKKIFAPISTKLTSLFKVTEARPQKDKMIADAPTSKVQDDSIVRGSGLRKTWRRSKTDVERGTQPVGLDIASGIYSE